MSEYARAPVIVGGSGGSGTRVVAEILRQAGCFIGTNLNVSNDALDLADFDWIWGRRLLLGETSAELVTAFEEALVRHFSEQTDEAAYGWKHPHSHLFIPFLAGRFPEMKFVHVVRDGRSIALSDNQLQVCRYADIALGRGDDAAIERRLRFWAWANERAAREGKSWLGDRFLHVGFEELCARPEEVVSRLLKFSGLEYDDRLSKLVSPPFTADRGVGVSIPGDVSSIFETFGYRATDVADARSPGRPATPPWIRQELGALLDATPIREQWPTVTIIVPTFNGKSLLERLLQGLADCTDYSTFDVVVVDNNSQDGTLEWLEEAKFSFPLKLIRNPRNFSFSAASNIGASAARGDLLLFLNNDIEVVEPHWLRRLVACKEVHHAGMAGAILIDPTKQSDRGRFGAVHHHGIGFEARKQGLRAVPFGRGRDLSDLVGPDIEMAATTGACALVARRDFETVGGFNERYVYGCEDVDICLRLRQRGRPIIVSGSTVLLHRPMSTRRVTQEGQGESTRANHRLLREIWGPVIRRECEADRAKGGGSWVAPPSAPFRAPKGAEFCLKAHPSVPAETVAFWVEALRGAGRRARHHDANDEWLVADIIVHLLGSAQRMPLIAGRLNVAIGNETVSPDDTHPEFDVVFRSDIPIGDLVSRSEAMLGPDAGRSAAARTISGGRSANSGRRAVIVLGMSRSGTSMVARTLNLLGVDLGNPSRLMAPAIGVNDKGFYENLGITRLNAEILRRLGGSWDVPPFMQDGWAEELRFDDLKEQATQLLEESYRDADLWGFKDPRLCLTLPFWRPLIGPAAFVICHRNPLEVADSLQRRDRISPEAAMSLWRVYAASAVAQTTQDERMFVSYDGVFQRPDETMARLADFVGKSALASDPLIKAEIRKWIDPELRHHRRPLKALFDSGFVKDDDRMLHLLLDRASQAIASEPDKALDLVARRTLAS